MWPGSSCSGSCRQIAEGAGPLDLAARYGAVRMAGSKALSKNPDYWH